MLGCGGGVHGPLAVNHVMVGSWPSDREPCYGRSGPHVLVYMKGKGGTKGSHVPGFNQRYFIRNTVSVLSCGTWSYSFLTHCNLFPFLYM